MDDGDRALNGLAFIVTGSAAGIGLATVNRLLAQGACVLGVDKCAMPAADLPADAEKQFYSLLADVTDAEAPDAIVGQAMARFGRLDGLTNNAGAYPRGGVTDTSPEIYDRVMRLNLRAPFFLAQAVIGQALKTGKPCSLVNIGSINAHCGLPELSAYAMAKGGLMTMTRNLANSLAGTGIRVNQLNVGWTDTEGEDALQRSTGGGADWREHISLRAAPRGTILQPGEVAEHVCFWLSPRSAPVSGSVCEVEQFPVIGRP